MNVPGTATDRFSTPSRYGFTQAPDRRTACTLIKGGEELGTIVHQNCAELPADRLLTYLVILKVSSSIVFFELFSESKEM